MTPAVIVAIIGTGIALATFARQTIIEIRKEKRETEKRAEEKADRLEKKYKEDGALPPRSKRHR